MNDERDNRDIVGSYRSVFDFAFEGLEAEVGQERMKAILEKVLNQLSQRHRILGNLRVSDDGLDWSSLDTHLLKFSSDEMWSAFQALIDAFFAALPPALAPKE